MEDGATYTDANGISVSRDKNEMKKYFNMIRFRAGLPGVTDAELNNREEMRKLIKREWQVEFALEGRRFLDLRRWGDLVEEASGYFYGMNVEAKDEKERKSFHTRTQMNHKNSIFIITNKLNFAPIKQSNLDSNAKLDQNPDY